MAFSPYSLVMAFIYCNVLILLLVLLRRSTVLLQGLGLWPLLMLVLCTLLRLCLPIELPSKVILLADYVFYPLLRDFWNTPLLFPGMKVGWLLLVIWGLGAAIQLFRFLYPYVQFRCAINRIPKAELPAVGKAAGSRKNLQIVRGSDAASPALFGFIRPVILLPGLDWTEEDLHTVLCHEQQHALYRDNLTKLVIHLFCCFLWWNPFVYLLRRDLDYTLELRCDLALIREMDLAERKRYYKTILWVIDQIQIRRKLQRQPYVTSLASTKKGKLLQQRFVIGLYYKPQDKLHKICAILLCVLFVLLFLLSYTVQWQPSGPPTETENVFSADDFEGGYLVQNKDGSYTCYIENKNLGIIQDPTVAPFAQMPIYKEKELHK